MTRSCECGFSGAGLHVCLPDVQSEPRGEAPSATRVGRAPHEKLPPLPTFTEGDFKGPLLDALNALPGIRAWRQQAGRLKVKRGFMHLAPKGAGDIIGRASPDGLLFEVETKGLRTAVQDGQDEWALETIAAGAVYLRARARRGDTVEVLVRRTVTELLEAIAECRSRRNHDAALRREIEAT